MSNVWTDELKAEAREMYLERIEVFPADERPSQSMGIVEAIADELGFSKNAVRVILQKMKHDDGSEVYIRAGQKPKAKPSEGGTAGKRVSKADAHAELRSALEDMGCTLPEDYDAVTKSMTGKLAITLATTIREASQGE